MRQIRALPVALVLLITACGSPSVESDSSLPSTATTISTSTPGETTAGSDPVLTDDCTPDQICEVDYNLREIELVDDDELEEIAIDGGSAYVTTDSGSVLVVDLAAGVISETYEFDSDAVDVALNGTDLWVLTLDGPIHVDTATGTRGVAGVFPTKGIGGHIAIGHGSIWVTTNGTGEVTRFDPTSGEVLAVITDYDNLSAGGTPRIAVDDTHVWAIDENGGRLLQIDPATNAISEAFDDLGFSATESGDFTTILADGPRTLAVVDNELWVLSDLESSQGENITGFGRIYRFPTGTTTPETVMDIVGDPQRGASFAVTPDAIWYIEFTANELIRVDRVSGLQHRLRPAGFASGNGVALGDGIVWMTANGSLLGANVADVAAALDGQ